MAKNTLGFVENALNGWLKPKLLGESWDNIGLLVGSGRYSKEEKPVNNILLCNDLTSKVVAEAISSKTDLIIAYHPPIFAPLKAVAYGSWKQEIIAKCLAYDIAVYSPHTTLDAVIGGINDRIIDSFRSNLAPSESTVETISTSLVDSSRSGIVYRSSPQNISRLYASVPFNDLTEVSIGFDVSGLVNRNEGTASLLIYALKDAGDGVFGKIKDIVKTLNIPELSDPTEAPPAALGAGRVVRFSKPLPVEKIVESLQRCTGVSTIKLAQGPKSEVLSVALCVGSGASILKGLNVDVLVTGEMTHHDVLDCLEAQQTVMLCGHADSERHYLPTLAEVVKITTQCPNVKVSETDRSLFRFIQAV